MKVNFNNLRRQAYHGIQGLTDKLNKSIIKNNDQYAIPNDVYHGQQVNLEGYVLVDAEEIEETLNELNRLIGFISCVSEEGNEEFLDLTDELPDPVWFNNEND